MSPCVRVKDPSHHTLFHNVVEAFIERGCSVKFRLSGEKNSTSFPIFLFC